MLGGQKESPPDGQYLDLTDLLWHLQETKRCLSGWFSSLMRSRIGLSVLFDFRFLDFHLHLN